jgi:hypothetical protein
VRVTHSKQSQQASEEAARQVAIHKRALVTAANEKETLAERLAQKERQLRTLQKEREGVREAEGADDREARWRKQIETERVAAVKVRFLRDWVFVRPLERRTFLASTTQTHRLGFVLAGTGIPAVPSEPYIWRLGWGC